MPLLKCLILVVFLPSSISEYCSESDSLFDRGLEKVLRSDRFAEITLPDFSPKVGELLGIRVGFFEGKLHGLRSIRKNGRSMLNVNDSGSSLTFHIVGGPFVARYSVGLWTGFLRNTFDLGVQVRRLHGSFTVQESSPNELQLEVHGVNMSSIRLLFDDSDGFNLGGVIYDVVFERLKPLIQREIGRLLAKELRKLAQETIGAVKVYAATSTSQTILERARLAWRKATVIARSYFPFRNGRNRGNVTSPGAYSGGRQSHRSTGTRLEPFRAGLERQRDIFDGCLKTLVVSTGFEPTPLPADLEEFSASSGSVTVPEGNVTGLSSIRRKGDSSVTLDDCGLRAHLHLAFKGLTVTATASFTYFYVTTSVIIEMKIPEVEAVLDIKENNTELQIVAYELNFTAPVTVTAKPLGAVGTVANFFGGLSEMTLSIEELKELEVSTRKHVQRIAQATQEFIADPPLLATR